MARKRRWAKFQPASTMKCLVIQHRDGDDQSHEHRPNAHHKICTPLHCLMRAPLHHGHPIPCPIRQRSPVSDSRLADAGRVARPVCPQTPSSQVCLTADHQLLNAKNMNYNSMWACSCDTVPFIPISVTREGSMPLKVYISAEAVLKISKLLEEARDRSFSSV